MKKTMEVGESLKRINARFPPSFRKLLKLYSKLNTIPN